jgi:hypothetical protein
MAEYIERTDAMNAVLVGDIDKDFPCMDIAARLHDIPAADVRPVVLCRDCEYWQSDCGWCGYFDIGMNIDDFCSRGEKREES